MSIPKLRLSRLDDEQRAEKLAEIVAKRNQPLNGEAAYVDEKIAEYETRYEMSSETMVKQFRARQLKETADICSWMMLLDVRDNISR